MSPANSWRGAYAPEDGNVFVEFIAVVIVLLLPLIYFAQSVAIVTKSNLAIQNASQLAARAFVVSSSDAVARVHARSAVTAVITDAHLPRTGLRISVKCSAAPCLTASQEVSISVSSQVSTPAFGFVPRHVFTVSATHTETVDEIRK